MSATKKTKTPPENSVIFIRNIPRGLKNQFKGYCARRGLTMKQVLMAHVRKCVASVPEVAPE